MGRGVNLFTKLSTGISTIARCLGPTIASLLGSTILDGMRQRPARAGTVLLTTAAFPVRHRCSRNWRLSTSPAFQQLGPPQIPATRRTNRTETASTAPEAMFGASRPSTVLDPMPNPPDSISDQDAHWMPTTSCGPPWRQQTRFVCMSIYPRVLAMEGHSTRNRNSLAESGVSHIPYSVFRIPRRHPVTERAAHRWERRWPPGSPARTRMALQAGPLIAHAMPVLGYACLASSELNTRVQR